MIASSSQFSISLILCIPLCIHIPHNEITHAHIFPRAAAERARRLGARFSAGANFANFNFSEKWIACTQDVLLSKYFDKERGQSGHCVV